MRQQTLVEIGKYIKRVLVLGQGRVKRTRVTAVAAVQNRCIVGRGATRTEQQDDNQDKRGICGSSQRGALSCQPVAASIVSLLIAATYSSL